MSLLKSSKFTCAAVFNKSVLIYMKLIVASLNQIVAFNNKRSKCFKNS